MTASIDRIPDSLGYLVLNEDGAVINSGGDLENNEDMARRLSDIVYTACHIPLSTSRSSKDKFKKLSIIWDTFQYVITVSNHKIYVSKRKYVPQEAQVV